MPRVEAAYFTPSWFTLWLVLASGVVLLVADFQKDYEESTRLKRWGHSLALAFAVVHIALALIPRYRHMSLAYLGGARIKE